MSDTIAAIATAPGPSAIGVVRLSGPDTCAVLDRVFRPKNGRPMSRQEPRRLVLGDVLDRDGQVIDSALAVLFPGPGSYTGQDCGELQCHGSPVVLDAALGYTGDLPALPPYLHVLGANETGLAVLRCARQAALLPLSHSLADLAARSAPAARVAAAHAAAEDLTALCLRHPAPMGAAYTAKPVFPTSGAK